MPADASVLIVGAGPVGLVLACELARAGVRFRLVDRLPEPNLLSKAVAVHARSLEMLDAMRIVDQFLEAGVAVPSARMYAGRRQLAEIDLSRVESDHPYVLCIAQDRTEGILTDTLRDLGGRIERGVECTALTQLDDSVRIGLRHADGRTEQDEFAWVVGCDGGHSTVRELAGTSLEGGFRGAYFILADVDIDHDLDRRALQMFLGDGAVFACFPLPGRRCRLVAQVVDAPPAGAQPTLEQVQELATKRMTGDVRLSNPRWLTGFEVHHGQVPQYRIGHVMLAGDAAHIHSPAGGQGMNTGMQDAYNLGWKLALVSRGAASEALLDSYQAERHPVAAAVVKETSLMTNVATVTNPVARHARRLLVSIVLGHTPFRRVMARRVSEVTIAYRESPIVGGARRRRRGVVRPGDHAPTVAGRRRVFGKEFRAVHSPPAVPDNAHFRKERFGELVGNLLLDDEASLSRYGHDAIVLVRPDGYVGYVSHPANPDAVAAHLEGVLEHGQSP